MAEEIHLTGPFHHQPPSPDHQTLQCDFAGHLHGTDREGSPNHANQNHHGGEKVDIYPGGYARKIEEETSKEQTPNTESEYIPPSKEYPALQGSFVSCL